MGIFRSIWQLRPLVGQNRHYFNKIKGAIEGEYLRDVKRGLNTNKLGFETAKLGISDNIGIDAGIALLHVKKPDKEAEIFTAEMNTLIEEASIKQIVPEFAKKAESVIPKYIAHTFPGLENVKKAVTALLFAKGYPVHVLLIGDPNTGKKTIMKSVEKLYSKTSSGPANAGLAITKEMTPGLLPMANGGICLLYDLAIKKEDYSQLYSAMENGAVTFLKAGKQEKLEAKARVLGIGDPVGGKFRGDGFDTFIRQLSFEHTLLSKFPVLFFIRNADKDTNVSHLVDAEKTKISDEDIRFIREYIKQAEKIDVAFPKELRESAAKFKDEIMKNEDNLFFGATEKTVDCVGYIARAYARMSLRSTVTQEDVDKAKNLVLASLMNDLG